MKLCIGWVAILVSSIAWAGDVPATRPASTRPATESVPVEKAGVAVSIAVTHSPVPADQQPELFIRFKNLGNDYVNLYDVGAYWNWKIQFTNSDPNALQPGPWMLRMHSIPMRGNLEVRQIKPGESTELAINLNDPPFTFEYGYDGAQDKPIRPRRFLQPGRYQVTAKVSLPNFPIGEDKHFWLGPVQTKAVELTIVDATPHVASKEELAAYDQAIARVTAKLGPGGLWLNGVAPKVDLPRNATVDAAIDMAVNQSILGSKDYRVLHVAAFEREGMPGAVKGHAALVRVGKSYKVAVLFPFEGGGWWSRFYDAEVQLPATPPAAKDAR